MRAQQAEMAQQEEDYNNFANTILNEIQGFNSLGDQTIELSVNDMNDLANFVLTRDETGTSDFGKVLQNPRALTTAAFWTLKGPEIMAEMQQQIQDAYRRGYADAKGS